MLQPWRLRSPINSRRGLHANPSSGCSSACWHRCMHVATGPTPQPQHQQPTHQHAKRYPLMRGRQQQLCRGLPEGLQQLSSSLLEHGDVAVAAAASASFKLLLLCAVVAWMTHRKLLDPATSKVLSRVGFTLTIPATLLTSTTRTLSNPTSGLLVAVPAMAALYIAVASVLGQLAAEAVAGRLPLTRTLLGWKELHPTESAAAIAASTAAALRAPQAASALIPTNQQPPAGLQQLIELSCAFGNSLTLPLLFCSTMLTGDGPLRATAYISLFHAAWSPLLWVWGYGRLMAAASSGSSSAGSSRLRQQTPGAARGRQPTGGLLNWAADFAARLVALWPQSSSAKTPSSSTPASPISKFGQSSEVLVARQLSPAAAAAAGGSGAAGRPVFAVSPTPAGDTGDTGDQGSPAEVLFKRLLKLGRGLLQLVLGPGVVAQLKQALSPPVVAVIAGVLLGCSPLGLWLADPSAAAQSLPTWEVPLLLGLLRCSWETLELLASATLAVSALVLATSLFGPKEEPASSTSSSSSGASAFTVSSSGRVTSSAAVEIVGADGQVIVPGASEKSGEEGALLGSAEEEADAAAPQGVTTRVRGAATADDASASVLDQLRPQGAWEWRLLVVVALVRFVAMPAVAGALVYAGVQLKLLPDDPICWFVLLLQGVMPPAQNLVLMMQLRSRTAKLGPAAARLLLQLYVLAIVPVTLWVSAIYPVLLQ